MAYSVDKIYWSRPELRRLAAQLARVGPQHHAFQCALDDLLTALPLRDDWHEVGNAVIAHIASALYQARHLSGGADGDIAAYALGLALFCRGIGVDDGPARLRLPQRGG